MQKLTISLQCNTALIQVNTSEKLEICEVPEDDILETEKLMTAFTPRTRNESDKLHELLFAERNITLNYDQAIQVNVQNIDESTKNLCSES